MMIIRLLLCLQWANLVVSFCQASTACHRKSSLALLDPSSTQTGSNAAAQALKLRKVSSKDEGSIGMYVHIPYCRRRCRYCDFAIVPIGPKAATDSVDEQDPASQGFLAMNQNYTAALLKEISLIPQSSKEKIPLRSIYFGGGTPSLAPIETLQLLLDAIRDTDGPFILQDDAEISIEMDPGTFSKEKLKAIMSMGFNRVSLGVQSFDDRILESLGRMHRSKDIWESLVMLQEVYGSDLNYSLDLISGLPGLSLAQWTDTLNTAVHLQPQPAHLSLYDLQIEGGTVFGKWYDSDKDASERSDFKRTRGQPPVSALILPSEENCAFMYKYAAGYLRSKGYEHYEVSSYALTGDTGSPSPRRSQHNQIYWETDSQWYALGLGATSFTSGVMKARPKTLVDYVRWVEVEASSLHDIAPIEDYELLTDVVLKRLRTSEGLKLKWVARRFAKGDAYVELILRGAQLGLELDLVKLEDNVLRLADPTGFLYSNTIISSIFAELEAADTHR